MLKINNAHRWHSVLGCCSTIDLLNYATANSSLVRLFIYAFYSSTADLDAAQSQLEHVMKKLLELDAAGLDKDNWYAASRHAGLLHASTSLAAFSFVRPCLFASLARLIPAPAPFSAVTHAHGPLPPPPFFV